MRKHGHWLLIGIILALLAGCSTNVPPAAKRPDSDRAGFPAIAIQADGTRHTVWAKLGCGTNGAAICAMIYERTTLAGQNTRIEIGNANAGYVGSPDIAVNAAGDAYLAWNIYNAQTNKFAPFYGVIPAGGTTPPAIIAMIGEYSPVASAPAPHLVARGTAVYALYHLRTESGILLRSRQLAPTAGAIKTYNTSPNSVVADAAAAIDSAGNLHVAYQYLETGAQPYHALFYQRPDGLTMLSNTGGTGYYYSAPAIAIDSANTAYLAYADFTSGKALRVVKRTSGGAQTDSVVPMPANLGPWSVAIDTPALAITSSGYSVAFLGSNGSTAEGHQVMLYSSGDAAPKVLSNHPGYLPYKPLIGALDGYPLVVWRDASVVGEGCEVNAYLWSTATNLRLIHAGSGLSCNPPSYDLATNGGWGAGIYIESGAWVAFNAPQ